MEQKMLSEAFMLLRESRFDEAKKAFEEVLLHYPDNAKAYWGRLRARYHITYVIVMGEKSAPTCPTRSGENIMKDVDYIKAMTYADDEEKTFMMEQAEYIRNACTPSGLSKNRIDRFTLGEIDPNDEFLIEEKKLKNKKVTFWAVKQMAVSAVLVLLATTMLIYWVGIFPIYHPSGLMLYSNGNFSFRVGSVGKCTDTEIEIPSEFLGMPVKSIDASAFAGCSDLTSITIPSSVKNIGASAFYGCDNLTSLTIPDSVTSIGEQAFSGCDGLTSITLPFVGSAAGETSNTHFGYIFGVVPASLKTVVLTGGSVIKDSAFSDCTGLTSITIPGTVTSIGDFAFSGCTGLTSMMIPDSVTSIGEQAFSGCDGLTSVTLPFVGSAAGETVNTHFGYIFGVVPASLKTVVLTGGSVIKDSAFSDCTGLTSITIPSTVTSIGASAFSDCVSLTNITIPGSVTSIGDAAFEGCSSLTSFEIFEGLTRIGNEAFYGCTKLSSVVIPDGVTEIGESAFRGCLALTEIFIPDDVTSIGEQAFHYCTNLSDVQFGGTVEQWKAVYLGSGWAGYTSFDTIICTDGTLSKN